MLNKVKTFYFARDPKWRGKGGSEIHPLLRFFEHNEKTTERNATVFAYRPGLAMTSPKEVVVILQPQVVEDRFKT